MARCEDCGTSKSGGICPNCHEELFILTYQAEYVESVSPEFQAIADEQKDSIKRRGERWRS